MEDYGKCGSCGSAENAVIGRSIVARYLNVAVGAVALMLGVDIIVGVRFLDLTFRMCFCKKIYFCKWWIVPTDRDFGFLKIITLV